MKIKFDDNGNTPLDPDELLELIPQHIQTQSELNNTEQLNITIGELWLFKVKKTDILDISFLRKLHQRMFNKTWRWAGQFRKSNKNIGIEWLQIPTQLKLLLDDVKYWIKNNTYEVDEVAVRFHHKLVFIHPFVNGNGRHARLITDKLLVINGRPKFSWGIENLQKQGEIRSIYIAALRAADNGNYKPLLDFLKPSPPIIN